MVTGEADPFGESTGRDIAESLPNGTLVVLPGAGHFGYLEPAHREAWAGTILEFLA